MQPAVQPPLFADDPTFPNDADVYRHRKQRGVNLGSWFVLERWITDAPFRAAAAPAQSDLDVARGEHAQAILEEHWDTWMAEQDWAWLAERGINTVRIPIGYYHICGADPSVLPGTDFAEHEHVFRGAWRRITQALDTAHRHGLGVLIDLHAAPGKQNADAHAGTSAPGIGLFTSPRLMRHTTHVLATLLRALTAFARTHDPPLPNLVGLELLNEPAPGAHGAALQEWYRATFRELRAIDARIPLYIGDAWQTDHYAGFLAGAGAPFAVLDHHLYRCFTGSDIATPAAEHARALADGGAWAPQMLARAARTLSGAGCALVVAEWSCGLNPGSLHGVDDEAAARRGFVDAQLALYEEHCAGWFFWTYKKEHAGDAGWSLRDAVAAGVFPGCVGLRAKEPITEYAGQWTQRDAVRDWALGEHTSYWSRYPGHYEHWRFSAGFCQGWDDAWTVFSAAPRHGHGGFVQELGFAGPWAKRRVQQHAAGAPGGEKNLWEYEHGFSQGLMAARQELVRRHC